jgi:hypothetical protein
MLPIKIKNYSELYFQINWMLHDRCTYACSYCPPSNHAGSDSWLDLDKVISVCESIEYQIGKKRKMQILFSGGEPTVWKNFPNLIEHLFKKGWSLNVITNLSRSKDWWNELDVKWDCVSASFHPEFVDVDQFIEKCNIIKNKSNILCIRVMLHPDKILFNRAISNAFKIFQNCPEVYIEWIPIIYEFGGAVIPLSPYSDDQNSIISKLKPLANGNKQILSSNLKSVVWENSKEEKLNAQFLVKNNLNKFKGWSCSAGLDGIFINSKGEVFRGTCLQGEILGNIQDGFINLPSDPVICEKKTCECLTDVYYSKEKI